MKKLFIITAFLLLLAGCSGRHSTAPEISPVTSLKYIDKNEIVSFTLNEKTDSYNAEYSTNCIDFAAAFSLSYSSDTDSVNSSTWDGNKWGSFINDLYDCGVLDWHHKDFEEGAPCDWSIVMTGGFGITTISGSGAYPPKWQEFKDIINNYFGETK